MAGLLGDSLDDPRTMALFALAQGLTGNKRLLPGLLQGAQGYGATLAQAKQQEEQRKRGLLQEQMLNLQMEQQRAQMADQAAQRQQRASDADILRGAFAPLPGPQMDGTPGVAPRFDVGSLLAKNLSLDALPQAMAINQAINPGEAKPEFMNLEGTLVQTNAQGGPKPVFTAAPKPQAAPSAVQEYEFAVRQGYKGDFTDWKRQNAASGATRVQVDAGTRFENEYSKSQGKAFSETMDTINRAGFNAPAQIRKLERLSQLLEGVDGGKLAPLGLDIASAANSIGIKIDPKLGNKEASEALAREIAGGFRQPGTGPMTDKDFENFLLQVPSLSKSAEGRKQITRTMQSALNRDIALAKMARDYERRTGRLDNGFLDEAAQFIAENPVVGSMPGWKVK